MLEVVPKFLLSSNLLIFEGTRQRGQIKTLFLAPHSLNSTIFLLDDICYKPSSHPRKKAHKWLPQSLRFPWNDENALYIGGESIAHAKRQRTSLGGRLPVSTYLVKYENRMFQIVPRPAGGAAQIAVFEKIHHRKHESHEIGSIAVPGWLATKTVIDLPESLPLFLQVYILWLSRSVRDSSHHV